MPQPSRASLAVPRSAPRPLVTSLAPSPPHDRPTRRRPTRLVMSSTIGGARSRTDITRINEFYKIQSTSLTRSLPPPPRLPLPTHSTHTPTSFLLLSSSSSTFSLYLPLRPAGIRCPLPSSPVLSFEWLTTTSKVMEAD